MADLIQYNVGFILILELPYRVVIFPSKKSGAATTSANVWVAISGSLGETQQVATPRGTLEFVFHVSSQWIQSNFCTTQRNNLFQLA